MREVTYILLVLVLFELGSGWLSSDCLRAGGHWVQTWGVDHCEERAR